MLYNFVQVATMLIALLLVCALMIARCPDGYRWFEGTRGLRRLADLRTLPCPTQPCEAYTSAWTWPRVFSSLQESSEHFILRTHCSRDSLSFTQAEGAVNRSVHSSPASRQHRSTTTTHPASTPAAGMEATHQLSSLSSTLPLVVGVGE